MDSRTNIRKKAFWGDTGGDPEMLGTYRSILCAVASLMLVGAQEPKEGVQPPTAEGPPPREVTETQSSESMFQPYPKYNPDPCYNASSYEAASLCAEWRAALAAEEAAREAKRATTWAIAGVIFGLITVTGLIVTLWQTHGALGEARRGNRISLLVERRSRRESREAAQSQAKALELASKQYDLAEQSSKVQLRSYLAIEKVIPYSVVPPGLSAKVYIKNVGQTPARVKRAEAAMWLAKAPHLDPMQAGPPPKRYWHFVDFMAQGAEDHILVVCDDSEQSEKLNSTDQFDVFVYGKVIYEDVFGDEHWISFAFNPAGWGFNAATDFRPCVSGNDSD